ncbi:MAG: hypothetical protein JNM94_06020 [Phycisphaerae bacterium]|nr:hypothetical protein [Phycisphaerae bacterium]
MRSVLSALCVATLLSLGVACSSTPAVSPPADVAAMPPWPSMSGVAELADGRLLVVHDAKPGSREHVLGVVAPGIDDGYRPIALPAFDPPLSDVEALVAVPDATDQFLFLESGASGAPRRVVRFEMTHDAHGALTPTVLAAVDVRDATSRVRNAESLAIESFDVATGRADLLVADRTSLGPSRPSATVSVYRVTVHFGAGVAVPATLACRYVVDSSIFGTRPNGSVRCASDLVWASDGVLFGAATVDGGSEGPFASVLYRVECGAARERSGRPPRAVALATIGGFKVEGLARIGTSDAVWIATDDESFGGVVRAVALPATETSPPDS